MSTFADTSSKKFNSTFRKTEYFQFTPGLHLVRILQSATKRVDVHYVKNAYVTCLGDDCPICAGNLKIAMEVSDKEARRKTPGWAPLQQRHYINVLDRTPVKVCPKCNAENKRVGANYPSICLNCKEQDITNVKETISNRVKVLSKGKKFFEILEMYATSSLDTEGNPIPITSYDLQILVPDGGEPVASQQLHRNDEVEIEPEELYDLDNCSIKLNAEEINDLLRGISLKDIFAARRNSKPETVYNKIDQKIGAVNTDIQKKISELYGE
jgi:hypothetical protein